VVSRSETIDNGSPQFLTYPKMNASTNVSAVNSASLMGIHQALFVRGSRMVATASYPPSAAGSLVIKSILTLSARSVGIGRAWRSPYGLTFLCFTWWHTSHPATHSATVSLCGANSSVRLLPLLSFRRRHVPLQE